MDFNNLHLDCNCVCTEGCNPDTVSHFAIKTMKNVLRSKDFLSYWEKGTRKEGCDKICSLKGNSISVINEETVNEVKAIYRELFGLSPSYKPFFSIIKFKDNCGVVKHTPDGINPHHFDFYKCDTFLFTEVELIESTTLHN